MTPPEASGLFVHGVGAVSPAGWGASALGQALQEGRSFDSSRLDLDGGQRSFQVLRVPPPSPVPKIWSQPRLRRASTISRFTVAAAEEALGADFARVVQGEIRLGIVTAMMAAGVNYSRRFYAEVLKEPRTASPLLFPETVFNASASHLSAVLQATGPNYTLVADQTGFLQAIAVGAGWLFDGTVDGVLVVAAEEADAITAAALDLFPGHTLPSEGAGAMYLRREPSSVQLDAITDPVLFRSTRSRAQAAAKVRQQLPAVPNTFLAECLSDGGGGVSEIQRVRSWPGPMCKITSQLGEGFAAAGAWAGVAAVEALRRGGFQHAQVEICGSNLQSLGARFSLK